MIIPSKKISGIILIGLFIMGLFLLTNRTYAQETSMQSTLREIAGKISSLFTFNIDRELTEKEKMEQELQTRKDAVSKIFDLTLMEQKDLLNRLSALKDLSDAQKKMRSTLTNLLQENENIFTEINSRLEGVESINDAKKLANDFKNWRTLVYNPKAEKVVAFTFVFHGENILATAKDRLERIAGDLSDYQNSLKETDEKSNELLNKAESNIREAEELSGQAQNLIMIALNNSFSQIKNTKSVNREIARNISDSKIFTEKSMQYVRNTYNEFLELGRIINNE